MTPREDTAAASDASLFVWGPAGQKADDADLFEADDSPALATWFGLDGPEQTHNFHVAGDEDWVVFYVPVEGSQTVVTVETLNLGANCDTVVELYASDGVSLLAQNDNDPRPPLDGGSYLLHPITEAGLYFARVYHWNGATSGEGTEYNLRIWRELGPQLPGTIQGQVVADSGDVPIESAEITVGLFGSFPVWTTENDGSFAVTALDAGAYTLYAEASGFAPGSEVVVVSAGDIVQPTIRLQALSPVLSVTPDRLEFGEVEVSAYAEQSFLVSNTGDGLLQGSASVSAPFTIASGGAYNLAAGESQSVAVRFSPSAAGDFSSTVSFSGAGGATRPVSGHTPPVLEVTPDSRTVPVGGGEAAFSVDNTGGGEMEWTSEIVAGTDWIAITEGASGTNAGAVAATCQANGSGEARTGVIRVTAAAASPSSIDVEIVQSGQSSPVDLDGDGKVNAVDVQLVINAALGISQAMDCDVDGNGKVNAVDVQLVINGALGVG